MQDNAFENLDCEMTAISSRPQYVKGDIQLWVHLKTEVNTFINAFE